MLQQIRYEKQASSPSIAVEKSVDASYVIAHQSDDHVLLGNTP
jgi:hypothetical protein